MTEDLVEVFVRQVGCESLTYVVSLGVLSPVHPFTILVVVHHNLSMFLLVLAALMIDAIC